MKMKFDLDMCLNLWYDPLGYFGKLNSTLRSVVPMAMFVFALVLETLIFDIFLYLSFQTRPCNIRCQKHLQNSIENLFGNSRICVGKTTHMKTRDSNNNIKKKWIKEKNWMIYLLMINVQKIMSSVILWQFHRIGGNKDNFQHFRDNYRTRVRSSSTLVTH